MMITHFMIRALRLNPLYMKILLYIHLIQVGIEEIVVKNRIIFLQLHPRPL